MTVENSGTQSGGQAASGQSSQQTSAPESASGKGAATSVTTPASGGATSHGQPPTGTDASQAAAVAAAFNPNLKFKVLGQEKEFDPFMKDVIKDEATEKAVRELYEKAHGLDSVKADRKKYLDAYNELLPAHQELSTRVERLEGYLQEGNLAAFQREAGISDTSILKRAQQILSAMENPALKEQEEAEFERQQQQFELLGQNRNLMGQVARARSFELNSVLSRSDVQPAVAAFDAQHGQGSFAQEIINRGAMYWHTSQGKVDKSAEELVMEVMKFMGQAAQQTQAPVLQQAREEGSPPEAQGTKVVPPKKPVIPNITGKGTSPVKKTFSSIAEIRQHAKDIAANG